MEGYMRIGLLVLAAVIVFLMLIESRSKRRPARATQNHLSHSDDEWTGHRSDNALFQRTDELKIFHDAHLEDDFSEHREEPILIEAAVDHIEDTIHQEQTLKPSEQQSTIAKEANHDLLILGVFARPGQQFASYDLLQAISSAGMQFGEMKIFHYYLPTLTGKYTLFSLASATEPGYFDMDRIGDFACRGLTLFMDPRSVPDPEQAFELMLKTAEQLTDDLDGEMFAWPKQAWNDITLKQYRQKLLR